MATMGSWNGFDFEVSPAVVRGFSGLTIKGGSDTEDKVSDKQKYVQRKNSAITEIALNVYLNAYLGCNVRDEASGFISAAMEGARNYFYIGGKKLVTYQLMLTNAQVTETEIAADGTWVACKIALTFKQCEKSGGAASGSSGGSGGTKKKSSKQTVKAKSFKDKAGEAINAVTEAKTLLSNAIGKITGQTTRSSSSSLAKKAQNTIKKKTSAAKKAQNTGKSATKTKKKTNASAKLAKVAASARSRIQLMAK